jgi:pimeloyl-ACP methyl ester carboxylesterase
MTRAILGILTLACLSAAADEPEAPLPAGQGKTVIRENAGDYAVIVHGLLARPRSMRTLGSYLHDLGYHTITIGYPSTRVTLEQVAADFIAPAVAAHCIDPDRKVHFVAHSMGSLAVRKFLTTWDDGHLGRVVLLAAPNQGTLLVDTFGEWPLVDTIWGPATLSLGTGPEDFPALLPPPDYEVGVIMGSRCHLPFFAPLFSAPNDGVIPVESGRLDGMTDFFVVDATHGNIRHNSESAYQTAHFLKAGKFDHVRPQKTASRRERFSGPRATRSLRASRPVIFGIW